MTQDHVGHGLSRWPLGPHKRRQSSIEWAKKEGLCPDSEAARQQTDRERESTQAANAAAGLPALTGTPKQVAWAETIRTKALASPSNQVPRCTTDGDLDELVTRTEQVLEVAVAARRELEMQTSAKWWIGQRDQVDGHVHRAHAAAATHACPDLCTHPDAGKEAAAEFSSGPEPWEPRRSWRTEHNVAVPKAGAKLAQAIAQVAQGNTRLGLT